MAELTFIIPIGKGHAELAIRAMSSVKAQTFPCELLTMLDVNERGPAAIRNILLRQVTTEFVSFLDADDWVEPTFAEETIAAFRRAGGNCYIFTDFVGDDGLITETPCINDTMDKRSRSVPERKPYCGGTWHQITTLIPTAWAKAVNGFDEQLPAVEDTDFYLKLCTTFRCGVKLSKPLFHYTGGGKRSHDFRVGPDYDRVMGELSSRYGGKMGCCGDQTAIAKPIGEKQPGDVLAMALWRGNRTEQGRITGRVYPRLSFPRTTWVDPRDVSFSPQFWSLVGQPAVDEGAALQSVAEIAQKGMAAVKQSPYAPPTIEPDPPPVIKQKPDVKRVLNLARAAQGKTDEPIFVFPEKEYPSYSDIKRLAQLSGFDIVTPKQIDPFSRRPYIVVSPESPGQLNGLRAWVICWQLEYAGQYTNNYTGFKGDVWASDKAWADANNAKYVLMGSHEELTTSSTRALNPPTMVKELGEAAQRTGGKLSFDVTMLGYMIPRRQVIKDALNDLNWPPDYPGHDTYERDSILSNTRLMLHVHQHDNAPYIAPQRIAIAAAYHMPVISETVSDPGDLHGVLFTDYGNISDVVHSQLKDTEGREMAVRVGEKLHNYLCVERPFRTCVMEALNQR